MGQMGTTLPAGLMGALAAIALLTPGCASIPPEGAELSQTLGTQLETLESAHEAAIRAFFDAKETAARKFIEDEWTPQFAKIASLKNNIDELAGVAVTLLSHFS